MDVVSDWISHRNQLVCGARELNCYDSREMPSPSRQGVTNAIYLSHRNHSPRTLLTRLHYSDRLCEYAALLLKQATLKADTESAELSNSPEFKRLQI